MITKRVCLVHALFVLVCNCCLAQSQCIQNVGSTPDKLTFAPLSSMPSSAEWTLGEPAPLGRVFEANHSFSVENQGVFSTSGQQASPGRMAYIEALEADTADGSSTTSVRSHSPRRAVLLSAVLPGAGQVYNHQAWKIPIIYAGFAAVGYWIGSNYSQMKLYRDEYLFRRQHGDTPSLQDYANYPTANIYNMYQSYNKNFQLSVIVGVAVYGLNLIDALVFGHLYEFEISDDLSLTAQPALLQDGLGRNAAGVSLQFSF